MVALLVTFTHYSAQGPGFRPLLPTCRGRESFMSDKTMLPLYLTLIFQFFFCLYPVTKIINKSNLKKSLWHTAAGTSWDCFSYVLTAFPQFLIIIIIPEGYNYIASHQKSKFFVSGLLLFNSQNDESQ